MRKGDIVQHVHITGLGRGGVGIAKAPNGKKILIKGALPDSEVDVKIVQKKKSYLTAHIVRVHQVDKKWVDTPVQCPHYFFPYAHSSATGVKDVHKDPSIGCGGCKWQVMSYEKQLALKQDMLQQCFHGLSIDLLPILGSPQAFGYRNKIEFSFGKYLVKDMQTGAFDPAEHWQLGFHKQGEFSKVVDIEQCYLVSPRMHEVYSMLKQQLAASGLPVYDAKAHTGVLRHLVIREGVHTGHIMVNLSYASDHVEEQVAWKKRWNAVLKQWKQDIFLQEHITTFVLTANNGLADVVKGEDIHMDILWGEGRIFEELHITTLVDDTSDDTITSQEHIARFQISPFSFFQTNTKGAELLFGTAMRMLGKIGGNIIDLYCGSGTIGLVFLKAGYGKQVKGIEVVASAVRDAGENAKINGLADMSTFYCGKAEDILLTDPSIGLEDFFVGGDVLIVDPPREGLHPKVVTFLIALKKKASFRLLYISCNPTTMARDMALLEAGGYSLSEVQPVDMFPQTHHVECVSVLS